ncbi:MAG: PhoX family protein [Gammaproteobacteria bacterium]
MKNQNISFDEFDEINSPRPPETEFDRVVDEAISRRTFLGGLVTVSSAAFLTATGLSSSAVAAVLSDFSPVAANTLDTITVPAGYRWHVVAAWGDPLWSDAVPFNQQTRGDAASQARALGDNIDGMEIFYRQGRTLITVNNEYANLDIINGGRASKAPENDDDVRKGMNAHGVTVMEIAPRNGRWQIVKDSPFNRRITPSTQMELTGPAAGHALLRTDFDSTGRRTLGTWNNCGNGSTPWGTYLACEENFNGYFSSSDKNFAVSPEMQRYGVGLEDWGYSWRQIDERFDISRHPHESNRAGYVVEIDPADPSSTPKKRTALGRFKHENASVALAQDGRVVVYMGDDERGEFLYRFVSDKTFEAGGKDVLDSGQLYAAKFDHNGRGRWLPLTPATTGMSAAEICVYSRIAASKAGATTMDRPEWVATHPQKAEAYCALTNNKNRGVKPNAGGDDTPVGGPNPRPENKYGQIVRWRANEGDHAALNFRWDLFVLAGNPTVHSDAKAGSENINAGNMFNSPDGLSFDSRGGLWIQTDGKYSNAGDFAGQGNNQMLLGDTATGEIRRFLVGPKEAEITGLCWSADRKTMFVGVQHPGESGDSHFPGGGDSVPRSCIVAVSREDGGLVG